MHDVWLRRKAGALFLTRRSGTLRRAGAHFNPSCAVIATKEAIAKAGSPKQSVPALAIASCLAMTVHGALSCNNGHRYEKRHVEMLPANPVHRSSFIVAKRRSHRKTAFTLMKQNYL
jgi:hypothetical protein